MWKQQFTRRSNYAQVPAPARQFAFHFIAIKLMTPSYPPSNWLELLKEIAPGVTRVAVRYNPDTAPYAGTFLRTIEAAAPSFRIEPSTATARNAAEIEGAIAAIAREPGGGVVQIPDSFTLTHREPIVRVIAHHRLPAVYSNNSHQSIWSSTTRRARPRRAESEPTEGPVWIAAGALVANRQKFHSHAKL
jgi:hypothetical protein